MRGRAVALVEIVPGDFISIKPARKTRSNTAAKSDDLYRIDSGTGTRWDARAFEISFGYGMKMGQGFCCFFLL